MIRLHIEVHCINLDELVIQSQIIQNSKFGPINGAFVFAVYVNSHQTDSKRERKREPRSWWVDDSLWLCIADESCLAPQLLWQPEREHPDKKNEAKGRGFQERNRGERAG